PSPSDARVESPPPSTEPHSPDSERMSGKTPSEEAATLPDQNYRSQPPTSEVKAARLSTIWKPYSPSEEPRERSR
ncbi:MAG: hypothetical protein PF795_15325, partial [Kiritimatiellae bacterium]|nr:hypothetical protein [Kiritimatiellia bacterium]